MKSHKKVYHLGLQTIISALCLLITTQATPMTKIPEQMRIDLAKRALFLKNLSNISVETSDNEKMWISPWKINKMEKLKSLLPAPSDTLPKLITIKASMITKEDLLLLSTALDKIATGKFEEYYQSLEAEYKKSLTNKTVGEGELRRLITTAGKVGATELSSFLASYFLPTDMQKYLMIPQIVSPIAAYLKSEVVKKNKLNQKILTGHTGTVTNCEFSEDGKILITSAQGPSNNIIIWNGETGEIVKTITFSNAIVDIVKPSPDGSKFISWSDKKIDKAKSDEEPNNKKTTLILWDSKTTQQIKVLDLPDNIANDVEFSPDGKRIIIGCQHGEITVVDMNDPEEKTFILIADANTGNTIATHEILNNYPSATVSPNSSTMIIRSADNLQLYDINTGKMIKKLEGPTEKNYDAVYSTDGTKIATYDFGTQTVFIWNGITGDTIAQFDNLANVSIAINSDGTKIVTTEVDYINDNSIIYVWDVATQTKIASIVSQLTQITSVKFNPNNSMILAAGGGTPNMILYDASSGKQINGFPSLEYISPNFSSDGKRIESHIAYPGEKCKVILLDVSTGQKIHTFIAEHDLLEMTPDLLTIVSPDESNDQNFILWTSLSPEERETLKAIITDLNLRQAHLLYQLYTAKLSQSPLSVESNAVFASLPHNVQSMIKDYLIVKAQRIALSKETQLPSKGVQLATKKDVTSAPQKEVTPVKTWWQWLRGQ